MDVGERVRGYVCEVLGDCAPDLITAITRFTSGERHDVFRVSYDVRGSGTHDVVVRIARSDDARDPDRAEREAMVLRTVQGQAGPRLLDFRRSSEWFDAPTTCTQFVPGEQRELAASSTSDIESLGSVDAWIHSQPLEDLRPVFPETPEPAAYLASRIDGIDARLSAYVRDPMPLDIRRRIERARQLTNERIPAMRSAPAIPHVLQHGDIAGGNIIWNRGPVLIDWEYARLGDPADEIAYLFSQNALAPSQRQAFWRGYLRRAEVDADRLAERVSWWEPVTLLGSALWWIEQWWHSSHTSGHGADAKQPDYYLDRAMLRMDRLEQLFS